MRRLIAASAVLVLLAIVVGSAGPGPISGDRPQDVAQLYPEQRHTGHQCERTGGGLFVEFRDYKRWWAALPAFGARVPVQRRHDDRPGHAGHTDTLRPDSSQRHQCQRASRRHSKPADVSLRNNGTIALGVRRAGRSTWGVAINDSGVIVGELDNGASSKLRRCRRRRVEQSGRGRRLYEQQCNGYQRQGASRRVLRKLQYRGVVHFLYNNGVMSQVPNFLTADGINDNGQMICWNGRQEFLYTSGTATSLGTLGGNSYGYAINDNGQVVRS